MQIVENASSSFSFRNCPYTQSLCFNESKEVLNNRTYSGLTLSLLKLSLRKVCRLEFASDLAFSRVSDKQSLIVTKSYGKKFNLSCLYQALNERSDTGQYPTKIISCPTKRKLHRTFCLTEKIRDKNKCPTRLCLVLPSAIN